MNNRLLWIGFWLLTCLNGVMGQSDDFKIQFRNIHLEVARHNGAQGVGVSGIVGNYNERGVSSSLMHKELWCVVEDESGKEIFRSTSIGRDVMYDVWRLHPSLSGKVKANVDSDYWDEVLFVPFGELNLPQGRHRLLFQLVVSDYFHEEDSVFSEKFPIEVDVPVQRKIWVNWGGEVNGEDWPSDGKWFVQGAGGTKLEGLPFATGWLSVVEGDDIRVGINSVYEGRTSGFRLFKIQITQGRSYTYRDEFAAQEWSLDTLWQAGHLEQSLKLIPVDNGRPMEGTLTISSFEYWDRAENPLSNWKEAKVTLGGTGGPNGLGHSPDSVYVWFPLSCGAADLPRHWKYRWMLKEVDGTEPLLREDFYLGCQYLENLDVWYEPFGDYLMFHHREFVVGSDRYLEFRFSARKWSEMRKRSIWNGPLEVAFLVGDSREEGEDWEHVFGKVEIADEYLADWEGRQRMKVWMWIIGVAVVMISFVGFIIWMVRRANAAKVSNIRIG